MIATCREPLASGRGRSGRMGFHRAFRDADDVVQPSRQRESRDRGTSVGGGEHESPRTLVRCEELAPPERLEREPQDPETSRSDEKAGVAARQGERDLTESMSREDHEDECHDSESSGEGSRRRFASNVARR